MLNAGVRDAFQQVGMCEYGFYKKKTMFKPYPHLNILSLIPDGGHI